MNTETIAQSARLDIEGWLDTGRAFKAKNLPRAIHADLMATANTTTAASTRETFIQRINAHGDDVLCAAIRAVTVLQNPRVVFAFQIPGDDEEPAEVISGPFVDVHSIDPLEALHALAAIRSEAPVLQMAAMQLLQAEFKVLKASDAVGMAFLTAADRANFWPEGDGDEPPNLVMREALLERRQSLQDREKASRTQALRRLGTVERTVAKLSKTVSPHLRHLCVQTIDALQYQGNRWTPLAIELPQDCEPRFCVEVARAHDMLASALDVDPTSEIQGPMKRMAMAARKALKQCVLALRVIAGWIRALGELQASSQCEFCYRHRAGKKRCAVHLVKDHVTKEARLAVATHPLYVERFVELARRVVVQWALVRPLQVDAAARSRVEAEIRVHDLPNELVPQVGTLVVQLRRLQPIFGEVLAGEVALLFQKLLVLARETHRRPFGRSVAEHEANRQARKKIKALFTLRGFLVVWCSKGRLFPEIFPGFYAEGHDPAHPIIRDEPMVESEIARGFLRQRAWIEAEAELRRHTEIDRNDVMKMRGRGMSFDAIAASYGCSHETIAKLVGNGEAPRKRARLVGYVAKSRLRLSE